MSEICLLRPFTEIKFSRKFPDLQYMKPIYTLQSFYNTPHYNMDLDIHGHNVASSFFYHRILQNNYRKMAISWSFVKLSLYNLVYLYHSPIL